MTFMGDGPERRGMSQLRDPCVDQGVGDGALIVVQRRELGTSLRHGDSAPVGWRYRRLDLLADSCPVADLLVRGPVLGVATRAAFSNTSAATLVGTDLDYPSRASPLTETTRQA